MNFMLDADFTPRKVAIGHCFRRFRQLPACLPEVSAPIAPPALTPIF